MNLKMNRWDKLKIYLYLFLSIFAGLMGNEYYKISVIAAEPPGIMLGVYYASTVGYIIMYSIIIGFFIRIGFLLYNRFFNIKRKGK